MQKERSIGIQNMLSSNKKSHGEFQINSKKGEVQLSHYRSNRTKTNTYIEMTIESAAPTTIKNNIIDG
jgi:hypothetical protein